MCYLLNALTTQTHRQQMVPMSAGVRCKVKKTSSPAAAHSVGCIKVRNRIIAYCFAGQLGARDAVMGKDQIILRKKCNFRIRIIF